MKKLMAKRDILFSGKMYKTGEELPTYDAEIVDLWIKYGSASWNGDESSDTGVSPVPEDKTATEEDNSTAEKESEKEEDSSASNKPKIRGRNKR